MTETTTDVESGGAVEISPKIGVRIPPKMLIVVILALIGGGGGGAAWLNLATDDDLEAEKKATIEREQQNLRLIEVNIGRLDQHEKSLETVSGDVKTILDGQHGQFARDEADRATRHIKNRERWREEYDRLVRINRERLKSGRQPCSSIDCN